MSIIAASLQTRTSKMHQSLIIVSMAKEENERRTTVAKAKGKSTAGISVVLAILTQLCVVFSANAAMSWKFDPPQIGRVLYGGGWVLNYSLGEISASPEFSFPLQLVYLNNRKEEGLFGRQWFCPQLESTLIPRDAGTMVWAMPNGRIVGLQAGKKNSRDFHSGDGQWRAKISGSRQTVFNEEGWQFEYQRGRLNSITSPTGRVLEFIRKDKRVTKVQLRDPATKAIQPVIDIDYFQSGKQIVALNVSGTIQHRFTYKKNGSDDRLDSWQRSIGFPLQFHYNIRTNCLDATAVNRAGKPEIAKYRCIYVKSAEAKKVMAPDPKEKDDKQSPSARKSDLAANRSDPSFYRLVEDDSYTYKYIGANTIVLTRKNDGTKVTKDFGSARGIVATEAGTSNRKEIYYQALGKRYNGKLRQVEENGRVVAQYRYDPKTGMLSEVVDDKGISTFFEYQPMKKGGWDPKPIRISRGTRKSWRVLAEYAYDGDGRLTAQKDGDGNVTTYSYTSRGEIAAIADAAGGKTSFAYDGLGRILSVDRNGMLEKVAYDNLGRVAAHMGADGSQIAMAYDANGQLIGLQRNGKSQTLYRRDALGHVVEEVDPLGRVKKFTYDSRGNILSEHAANDSVTKYEYDAQNRRTAQIDGNGNRITFDYDPAGRLIKQTNALGHILSWSYDGNNGHLLERTNGVQTISYRYDTDNHLVHVDYNSNPLETAAPHSVAKSDEEPNYFGVAVPNPIEANQGPKPSSGPQTTDYTYDDEGRIATISTPNTQFEYIRDPRGRVEAMRCIDHGKEQLLRYRYDTLGRRTGLILAELQPALASQGGRAGKNAEYIVLQQTEYTYDSASRLASIIDNGNTAVSYSYDSAGRPAKKIFANGMQASLAYDDMGRLARIEFTGGPLSEPKLLTYEWNAANEVVKRSWCGEAQCYEYDASGQLLKASDEASGKVLESYMYDKAGNMLQKVIGGETIVMTYNSANELMTRTMGEDGESQTYEYDPAGRMLGYGGGARNHYGWLDKVTDLTLPDGGKVSYTYWPDGQLASKTGQEETFLWDGLALLRRNENIYLIEPHPSGGVPIASHPARSSGPTTWYLNDLLGTTLATVCDGETQYVKLTTFGQPLKTAAASPQQPVSLTSKIPQIPAVPDSPGENGTN